MSIVPILVTTMMIQQNNRRMHDDYMRRQAQARRRREEEERRKKQRQEEERKMIEHRKNSPIICNGESWQQNRCVKAISMQPCVQSLVSTIEEVRPKVIEDEERKYDELILSVGYEYEVLRKEIESDIEALRELGISIEGTQYKLLRLTPTNTLIGKPEQVTEFLGSTFIINNGQPIELNPRILSDEKHFEDRYEEMDPVELERNFNDTNARLKRYRRFGKYLSFLLNTRKYLQLEEYARDLAEEHDECELRKREMLSFKSLNKKQLLVIKKYFEHLAQLSTVSDKIQKLFSEKASLRRDYNENIYELTIKEIMSSGEYKELIAQVSEYIKKIYANDEQTMSEAYELVKGMYPIDISKRFIYDMLIKYLKNYKKEDNKTLKLS